MKTNIKKVAIVYPYLPAYRIPFFEKLERELEEHGIELTIYSGTNLGQKKVKEISSSSLKISKQQRAGFSINKFQVQWQKGLLREVSRDNPSMFIFMYNAGILNYSLLMLSLSLHKIPFYIWTSGHKRFGLSTSQHKIKDRFKSMGINRASGIISYSSYYKNQLEESGYSPEKIFVAQNTVNVENIIQKYPFSEIKRTYETVKFLFVGNVIETKSIDKALHCFKKIKEQGYNFQFDVVGEGYHLQTLKALSAKLGLQEQVNFHGAKYGEDAAAFFLISNVFLLPGTGGLAINEAMAYGLPIITTPGDGTAHDLVNKNGFLLDFNFPPEQLEDAIFFFLKAKPQEFRKMEEQSVHLIKSHFLQANMVKGFMAPILKELKT
ncbi:hypothetical protein GCM10007103_28980 [Salinimicrobium marinum]|uniref:Glycosyl transferase family 1 domain-containing protein n=1 Tax=Salinimicrobium marinum TaxID=680283 RepID=A0A918SK27_9FLAO|nr:glycosyltransferase family 4 protein [Salinimicrobium marinum]GHA46106.1 hypothetical protein GCM10007103_28980 [Salinimicrobium marinum]